MEIKALALEIKQHLNKHLNDMVSDVVVFGSRVWGNARNDSDFDVIIIVKDNCSRKIHRQINDLCYDIDLKYDLFLDTQIISEQELKKGIRGRHPVFKTALTKGIHA